MTGNAEEHDAERAQRMVAAAEAAKDAEEGSRLVSGTTGGAGGKDAFVKAATREVFAAMGAAGTSLGDRVASRKHFQER